MPRCTPDPPLTHPTQPGSPVAFPISPVGRPILPVAQTTSLGDILGSSFSLIPTSNLPETL